MPNIDIAALPPLGKGNHRSINHGACVMEAVSYIAGEPWSDHPKCACPVIATFLRSWNDALLDDERDELLRPLIPRLVNTRRSAAIEQRRATMAADWLIRTNTPAWLRLAGMTSHADALAGMPEITDFAACPGLMPTLIAVRHDADAARAGVRAAARDAAWAAAWAGVRAAAGAAARAAARAGVRAAARDAAWAAAWAAAWDAARAAAWDALQTTRRDLQRSAQALVIRMIEAA